MRKATFRTIVTLALVAAYGAPALAGAPAVSSVVCRKVKDLKMPAAVASTPSLVSVFTYFGLSNCELGKMTQICTPAQLNSSPLTEPFVGQCCFKAKCPDEIPTTITVLDAGTGTPTLGPNQILTSKKISNVCIACSYP